ncbi:MAG: alpha/beta fold hydrolase [Gemmataceae bacterium]|nr:alpha/beta fold hydrolase [Gemmataceae bacterium]
MYPAARLLSIAVLFAGAVAAGQPPAGDVAAVLKGHADAVDAVAVSPDGTLIATGSFDKTVKVWDAATGKELLTFGGEKGHTGQVLSVAFSPKGDLLASGGSDNFARVWEAPGGLPAGRFAAAAALGGAGPGLGFVGEFLPADKRLARRAAFAPAAPVKSFQHPNLVDAVAFDETGTLLATGGHDGKLRIWDVAKGATTKEIAAHVRTMPANTADPIYCVAWAPGGKQIVTGSFDKSLKLWDVASGNLVKEFKGVPDPKPEAKKEEMKKGKEEAKKDGKKEEPKKEEPKKEEAKKDDGPKGPPGHRDQVFTVAFTKDGKFLASGGSDRAVKLWDVATGVVVRDFPSPDLKPVMPGEPAPSHPGWVQGVRFTPDDKHLVTAGPAPRYKGYVAVWSVADGKRLSGGERDIGPVQALTLTPDGTKAVLGLGPKGRSATDAEAVVLKLPVAASVAAATPAPQAPPPAPKPPERLPPVVPAGPWTSGFLDSGGVKLHYVTAGDGPLVVLLHGFPDFHYSWRDQIPALSKHFKVVALDLRGYNGSDQPSTVDDYKMEKLVGDVAAVLAHFKQQKAVVVGHDWGGAIAWSFATAHPDKIDRLVILNLPHLNGLSRELANNPTQQKNSEYARNFQKPEAAKQLNPELLAMWVKEPEARKEYAAAFARSSAEGMLNYYKANYPKPPYKAGPELPPVKCPVLMIHGLDDQYLLAAGLNDNWKWVANEFTLVTVPGAGHFVHRDKPELVTRKMVRWLTEK